MKRTCKTIFSLVLTLLLTVSLATSAFAASSITFKGFSDGFDFQPGSEYTETDLFDGFKNVMPDTITFTNEATDCDYVNLYMRAEAHDEACNPLSETVAQQEDVATMTEFLSQLSMKVWNGTELVYDASPDQLDGLKDNTLLGTFRTGDTTTLKVELTVPIELDNRFANRVGEVDWIFHVEAYNESQLSVRKVWSDGNANHDQDSITVNLLKDGEVEQSQELNAENGWAYTFDRLAEGYTWTVEEADVPEDYEVSYDTAGTTTTITNTKKEEPTPDPEPDPDPEPEEPVEITACKRWSGDSSKERPDSVTVTLYDGKTAYETVRLSDKNDWSYTWEDLDADGNWQVVETNIPKGYVPSYKVKGDVVTITNTKTLIQTGQLNWPIWVLGGAGILLVVLGVVILTKRKQNDA